MAVLYVSKSGRPQRKHSYSAGNEYDTSAFRYFLHRIEGWKPKDDKASLHFGRALESAIEHFHLHEGEGGLEEFVRLWHELKNNKELKYTKTEKDWDTLNQNGQDMMRLYKIRQPELPIPMASVFQREYSKLVFESDPRYGEIEFAGKLDIICHVEPDHQMLSKLKWKTEYGILRPLIVDIKTSALDFPDIPGIAAFDKQLRAYSWLTGIRDVAMLWFKKAGRTLSKGSSVTMLEDVETLKAGEECVVAQLIDGGVYVVKNDYFIEQMNVSQGRKEDGSIDQTKAAKERKALWLAQNGILCQEDQMTRQRLQFNSGFVTIESANDAGYIAGRQIVSIVNSWNDKKWPQTFGIRFPQDDKADPYFRAFVLNDEMYKKQNFVQQINDDLELYAEPDEGENEHN